MHTRDPKREVVWVTPTGIVIVDDAVEYALQYGQLLAHLALSTAGRNTVTNKNTWHRTELNTRAASTKRRHRPTWHSRDVVCTGRRSFLESRVDLDCQTCRCVCVRRRRTCGAIGAADAMWNRRALSHRPPTVTLPSPRRPTAIATR